MSLNSTDKISKRFQEYAIATLVVTTGLSSTGCNQFPLTQNEGRIIGAAAGGILGSTLGGENKKTATVGGAVVGGIVGGAIADKQIVCHEEGETTRKASRDNKTGDVKRDTTDQTAKRGCEGGRHSRGTPDGGNAPKNDGIF